MRNLSVECGKVVQGYEGTHRVHSEAGSVPVQRGAQLLQLVVDTVSLPKKEQTLLLYSRVFLP